MKRSCILIILCFFFTSLSAQTFTLKSTELGGQAGNKQVLKGFGCNGENKSPQLYWEKAPADTKSFAVTIFDEDAPTGSGWWHWLIFDIPGNINSLKSDAGNLSLKLAPGRAIQSLTDFKTSGYGGPCPPEGSDFHKYTITVYALKVAKLGLDSSANAALVGLMLNQNLIEKATMVFYYKR